MEIKRGVYNIFHFTRNPSGVFALFKDDPDVIGSLLIIDTLAFLTAVYAAVAGGLAFSFSWQFLKGFLVLYVLMFSLLCMFVSFEAGYAYLVSRIFGADPPLSSLLAAMSYSRLPLVVGTVLYMFLPLKLNLANVLAGGMPGGPGGGFLAAAFLGRIEVFELMVVALQVVAVSVVAGLNRFQGLFVVLSCWVPCTAVFYYMQTRLL
jgi:hypothetical protein